MWDIDFEKNSIYLSKKWLEISGYGRDEIKSFADWFNLIHKDDKDEVKNRFDAILEGKEEQLICEYRLKTKNEGYKWILARGKIFKNEYDNYKRMLMMSMDIDKNKRLSKELLNVEMLVEDGHIVIFKWNNDKDLSVDFVSNSIKSYGYYKKDFENKSLNYMDIVFQEDKRELRDLIDYHIAISSKSFFQIYRIVDNGGKIRWIYSRVLLLKDDFGEVKYLYGYIHDITKLKRVEEELKERVKVEIEKNREKDSFIIQQNKLASMGEMLGSISHQWRQPLNNVNLILHFIRDNCQKGDFGKEKLFEYIRRAKTQIEYMSQTIEDFRNFYKPSKSKNRFEIRDCIVSALRIVEEQFQNSRIDIELRCKSAIFMYNYENELKQSLLNILNNAKDAILQKREKRQFDAKIKIAVSKEGGFVNIVIENNGGEIDEKIIDRIFEPYFTTKFETQGTGIGLYMTKIIVEKNLKGDIRVQNIDDGVRFTIRLPHEEDA
jgi:PAS domain S-box-containing protein